MTISKSVKFRCHKPRDCHKYMLKTCFCLQVPMDETVFFSCCGRYHNVDACGGRLQLGVNTVYYRGKPDKSFL